MSGPGAGAAWRLLAAAVVLGASAGASAQDGGGVTLNQYRAAPTARDGLTVARPIGLGHLGVSARLDVDYTFEPLRVAGMPEEDVLVDHQLTGQVGVALGLFDRFVAHVRLPVHLLMEGTPVALDDPTANAVALGDVALGARWVLYGEDPSEVFAIALAAEGTIPTAEAADQAQDLAGEAGPTITPEVDLEVRFAPVRIYGELGMRFREPARYQRLPVGNELTWGAGVEVEVVERVFDARLEAFGATPLDDFARARRSPVELLLGARLWPGEGVAVTAGIGAGLGLGYGSPRVRALLGVAWTTDYVAPAQGPAEPEPEPTPDDPVVVAVAPPEATPPDDTPDDAPEGAAPVAEVTAQRDRRPAGTAPPPRIDVQERYGNLDRDADRIVDAYDRCPLDREDYDEIQDDDGCPETDADEDQVADASDMCPLTPGIENPRNASCNGCPERACVSDEGTITISERVEFATGSDRILDQSEAVLEDVRAIIASSDELRTLRIEGHTDDRDSDAHNLTLSTSRAASVRRWLVEHGLDGGRFEAWGCGEAHPIESNRTRRGRQANRRVEFHIIDPPTAGYTPREGCVRAED